MKQLQELNVAGRATKWGRASLLNEGLAPAPLSGRTPRTAGGLTPFDYFIQWHLTERCNLRCRHCYQGGAAPFRRTGSALSVELSFPEIREVLDEISDMLGDWSETYGMEFSPALNITGGEPFLRQDLFDILREAARRGFDLYLLTNGTLVGRRRADMLRELGVKGVQVSIEGPEAVHDVIRGRGSFNASIEGIKKLLDAGLRVTMNVTLSKLNAVHMAEMVSLARSFGVQRLGFSRLVPAGRGLALLHKMLPAEEVKRLYESLLTHNLEDLEIVTGDPVAASQTLLSHDEGGCTALGGCAAGVSGLTILSDGTLTPCRRLHIPIGNVRIDSMREVWATSEVLDALRDKTRYKGRCGSCPRWADCRGCRAIAYAVAKEKGVEDPFLHEDPQCFHPH